VQAQRDIIRLVSHECQVERCNTVGVRAIAARNEVSIKVYAERGYKVPILQMYDPLNPNLRHIVEVEEYVCSYSEPEKNCRCYHEQDRVEVGLARRFGCRDADGLENEVLGKSVVSRAFRAVCRLDFIDALP
jgi:hypothetical protein